MPQYNAYDPSAPLGGLEIILVEQGGTTLRTTPNALANYLGYTLPVASVIVLGGIKAGGDISISAAGIVSIEDDSHNHVWNNITNTPTTISGYGITDAAPSSHQHAWSAITGTPTTISGYGITDAVSNSHLGGVIHIDWSVTGAENIHADRYSAATDHTQLSNIGTTSHDEIDTILGTLNVSNWDTAFGWGNHSTAGYGTLADDENITGSWTVNWDAPFTINSNIQPWNSYGGGRMYHSADTNRHLGRPDDIYVSLNTYEASDVNKGRIFDGSFETRWILADDGDPAAVVLLDYEAGGLTNFNGFTYAAGHYSVAFYPGAGPSAVTARVQNRDHVWTACTVTEDWDFAGLPCGYWVDVPINNYLTKLELTITPKLTGSDTCRLAQIEYHGDRMSLVESGLLTRVSVGAAADEIAAGDHTHAIGEITGFTDNSTNWDAAFGWGDHDGLYAPASHVGGDIHIDWSVTGAENIHSDRYTDTLYTLPVATASVLGGVKSGTDIAVDGSGNVAVVNNSHLHQYSNISDPPAVAFEKHITIEDPVDGDDITWFFTNKALTCGELRLVIKETGTGSCILTIRYGTDRNATGTIIDTNTVTSNTTGHDVTTFDEENIPADSFVWIEIGSTSNTDEVHASLIGTVD